MRRRPRCSAWTTPHPSTSSCCSASAKRPAGRSGRSISGRFCRLLFDDLDDVVADRFGNFLEPVRDTGGYDEDVAFDEMVRLPAGDAGAEPLLRPRRLAALHLSPIREGGFAI